MQISDFFITEVLDSMPDLPPDEKELLLSVVRDLVEEHMKQGNPKEVAMVLIATGFLAGRAYEFYAKDDTFPVTTDRETVEAFMQSLIEAIGEDPEDDDDKVTLRYTPEMLDRFIKYLRNR